MYFNNFVLNYTWRTFYCSDRKKLKQVLEFPYGPVAALAGYHMCNL